MNTYGLPLADAVIAAERGRRMTAEMLRENPEKRILGEAVVGIERMKERYPEAYLKQERQQ